MIIYPITTKTMGYQGIASNYDDNDLVPVNVKSGVDIFGVNGSFVGSYGGQGMTTILCALGDENSSIPFGVKTYEGQNYIFVVTGFSANYNLNGGDHVIGMGIWMKNKQTGEIKQQQKVSSGVNVNIPLDDLVEFDDTNGRIHIQERSSDPYYKHAYYDFTTNTISESNPGGTYVSLTYDGGLRSSSTYSSQVPTVITSTAIQGLTYRITGTFFMGPYDKNYGFNMLEIL